MADPMRLGGQAQIRALKKGCQMPERADGRGAASPVRLANCSWASNLALTGPWAAAAMRRLLLRVAATGPAALSSLQTPPPENAARGGVQKFPVPAASGR